MTNRNFIFYGGAILLGLGLGLLFLQRYFYLEDLSNKPKEQAPLVKTKHVSFDSTQILLTFAEGLTKERLRIVFGGQTVLGNYEQLVYKDGKFVDRIKPVKGPQLYYFYYNDEYVGSFTHYFTSLIF